jgi:hypothetical protein
MPLRGHPIYPSHCFSCIRHINKTVRNNGIATNMSVKMNNVQCTRGTSQKRKLSLFLIFFCSSTQLISHCHIECLMIITGIKYIIIIKLITQIKTKIRDKFIKSN